MAVIEKSFVIDECRIEDLDRVIEINRLCLPENYPRYFFEDLLLKFPKAFLVARVNGEVVAYVMCRIELGFSDFSFMKIVKKGHIVSIAVLPEHRRKGIGTELMVKCMENMKKFYGVQEYYLEVRVTNVPAIKLYKKLGFKVVRVLSRYYRDGCDAFQMARKVDENE